MRDDKLSVIYEELQEAQIINLHDDRLNVKALYCKNFIYYPYVAKGESCIRKVNNITQSYRPQWKRGTSTKKTTDVLACRQYEYQSNCNYLQVQFKTHSNVYYHVLVYFCDIALHKGVKKTLKVLEYLMNYRRYFVELNEKYNAKFFTKSCFEVVVDHKVDARIDTSGEYYHILGRLFRNSLPSNLQLTYNFMNLKKRGLNHHGSMSDLTYDNFYDIFPKDTAKFLEENAIVDVNGNVYHKDGTLLFLGMLVPKYVGKTYKITQG